MDWIAEQIYYRISSFNIVILSILLINLVIKKRARDTRLSLLVMGLMGIQFLGIIFILPAIVVSTASYFLIVLPITIKMRSTYLLAKILPGFQIPWLAQMSWDVYLNGFAFSFGSIIRIISVFISNCLLAFWMIGFDEDQSTLCKIARRVMMEPLAERILEAAFGQ
jgi:hypothetical protein